MLRLALLCLALQASGMLPGPLAPSPAAAQTSGGYSRPSMGGSFGGYSGFDRRPSIGSGGYSRPSSSSFGGFGFETSRGGDRAISRRASSQALQDYRASQAPPAASPFATDRRPSTGASGSVWDTAPYQRRPQSAPGFNAWDTVLAWSLLNSLSRPQSQAYFQDNRSDPGYARWRADADRAASSDPAVAQKLAELDAVMAQSKAQPVRPQPAAAGSDGAGVVLVVVLIGGAMFVGLWLLRRRAAAAASVTAPPGLTGSAASRFRVGMTFPVDPAPFLLAAGRTKVKPPATSGMISIEALGLINDTGALLHRLYLPGREAFFMLHLGPDGTPDECRYFSLLDQISPASRDEWGSWLDPAQGLIGWPQFQTKDGQTYDRIWAPGSGRVPPRQQAETIQDLKGTMQRQIQAMLYGRRTGAVSPAPNVEYVLVCAVEQGAEAWVEVYAGIDVNPTALTLPAVPLS